MTTTVFTATNFPVPAAPPEQFIPNVNGRPIPQGAVTWLIVFDTSGLPANQPFADLAVEYHYGSAGWLIDERAPLMTSYLNKSGQITFSAFIDGNLNLVPGLYPDAVRLHLFASPGYANVPQVTITVN